MTPGMAGSTAMAPAPIAPAKLTSGNARRARWRTPTPGCATVTTRTRSPTSRRRTPTPQHGWSRIGELVETIFERAQEPGPGDRHRRPGRGATTGGTCHARSRAPTIRSTAAVARPNRRPSTSCSTRTPRPPATTTSGSARSTSPPRTSCSPTASTPMAGEEYELRFRDLTSGADLPDRRRAGVLRNGLGSGVGLALLHPPGRGDAPLPGVAPPARRAGRRGRARAPGGRRAVLPRRRA